MKPDTLAQAITDLNNEAKFFSDTRAAIKNYSGEEWDLKPFEADMRHLINTYIQADPADSLARILHEGDRETAGKP